MIIYLVENLKNGKHYVGQTTFDLTTRWQDHVHAARGKSQAIIHKAIRKYGVESFSVKEIARAATVTELDQLEIRLIKELGTLAPLGYNQAEGGRNNRKGVKASEETKEKLKIAWANRRLNGSDKPNLGKKWTAETCQKISLSKKKMWEDPEKRKKISDAQSAGWTLEVRLRKSQQRQQEILSQKQRLENRKLNISGGRK